MKRILIHIAAGIALLAASLAPATERKPLTIVGGQIKALPSTDTLKVNGSATGGASINVPHGTAPTSPNDGDFWSTTSGFFGRVNGSTVGPFGTGGGGLSDGDKGDITVSSSGTDWQIDASAVGSSEIANNSVALGDIAVAGANSKLVGSGSAGSGASYSEITVGSGLSMSGTTLSATGSASFRGALVKKTADATTVNTTAGHNITFDAEEYDTDTIHDNVTNNTRLTSPSGVTKVRVCGQFYISGGTAGSGTYKLLTIGKNGSVSWIGAPNLLIEATTGTAAGQVCTPVVAVTGGTDYFELNLAEESDISVTIEADFTWFSMEIIE